MYTFKCLKCGTEQITNYPYAEVCECGGREFVLEKEKKIKEKGDSK